MAVTSSVTRPGPISLPEALCCQCYNFSLLGGLRRVQGMGMALLAACWDSIAPTLMLDASTSWSSKNTVAQEGKLGIDYDQNVIICKRSSNDDIYNNLFHRVPFQI